MWHARTSYVAGMTRGKHADREDDVAYWKIGIGHLASKWKSDMVPHGPDMGCHMAPKHWPISLQKIWSPLVLNLRPRRGWMAWQGRVR